MNTSNQHNAFLSHSKVALAALSAGIEACNEEPPVIRPPAALARPQPSSARRYWTGRTAQFNTRIIPAASDRFYQIADEQGLKIGETVERALAARERELGQGR